MSAFIVGEKTLNDVTTLRLKTLGLDPKALTPKQLKLANDIKIELYNINVGSVDYRYNGRGIGDLPVKPDPYQVSNESDVQLAKSFLCWDYQSCEKDSDRFERVRSAVQPWVDGVIPKDRNSSPEWQKAYWGD